MTEELHALFKGKVQGVGFRWTVVDHAEKLALLGTVRNLPNGQVEVIAQGPRSRLEALIQAIKDDPGSARLDSIKSDFRPPQKTYTHFTIIK